MEFQAYDIALVPIIIILTEIIKKSGFPVRFLPLVTIAIGQVGAFVYVSPNNVSQAILVGLVMAFSAMGLWSGAKNTVESKKSNS
jgi:hypothetical protein